LVEVVDGKVVAADRLRDQLLKSGIVDVRTNAYGKHLHSALQLIGIGHYLIEVDSHKTIGDYKGHIYTIWHRLKAKSWAEEDGTGDHQFLFHIVCGCLW
jgi:hypothetical protein